MTVQEAKKQISEAENTVSKEYSNMRTAAFNMVSETEYEARANTKVKTCIPLIACIVGLFCCLAGSWIWGILLIGAGGFVAYNSNMAAKEVESRISILGDALKNVLDHQGKI